MSFKNKENTIEVTICCLPASFTSGKKDACKSVVPTLSVTQVYAHTIIRITAFARARKSYRARLLFTHNRGLISVAERSCSAPVLRVHCPYWIGFCMHGVYKAYRKHLTIKVP